MYQRPENVLKRADELMLVATPESVLEHLHTFITSNNNKYVSLTIFEPIVLRHVEICVKLLKPRHMRDMLHRYKSAAQKTNLGSFEKVVRYLIQLAEQQVSTAQAKADQMLDLVEDLDEGDTAEALLMSTVSSDDAKLRSDRQHVTPSLRFLWETYRTVLDAIRRNSRLEVLYQEVVHHVFAFCIKYQRKTEFRRLCDILRQHLTTTSTPTTYTQRDGSAPLDVVQLSHPETLQRHMDTRILQLNVATDLELWQEAFRSVEDIHSLMTLAGLKRMKTFMLADYYGKLAKILLVGENFLFHAAAQLRLFDVTAAHPDAKSAEALPALASAGLIAALAVPIIPKARTRLDLDDRYKNQRLTTLLNQSVAPTRESLLADSVSKHSLLGMVPAHIKQLYQALEVDFHPLSICQRISPILEQLAKDPKLASYVPALRSVVLTRLIQQLSQVYERINMSQVLKLVEGLSVTMADIERFVMNACRKGELTMLVDHAESTLIFLSDSLAEDGLTAPGAPAGSALRDQLARLAAHLATARHLIDPTHTQAVCKGLKTQMQKAAVDFDKERRFLLDRQTRMHAYESARTDAIQREEGQRAAAAEERRRTALAEEKARLAEEKQRREEERQLQRQQEVHRKEAAALAEKLVEELRAKGEDVPTAELATMDIKDLRAFKLRQTEKENQAADEAKRALYTRLDHIQRALRKEEIPLLEREYETRKTVARTAYDAATTAERTRRETEHAAQIAAKKRYAVMVEDYQHFAPALIKANTEWMAYKRRELEMLKEADKETLRAAKLQERREERKREEERRQAEQAEAEERRREEERQEREEQERHAREMKAKSAEKERLARAEESLKQGVKRVEDPAAAAAPVPSRFAARGYVPRALRDQQGPVVAAAPAPAAEQTAAAEQTPADDGWTAVRAPRKERRRDEPETPDRAEPEGERGALPVDRGAQSDRWTRGAKPAGGADSPFRPRPRRDEGTSGGTPGTGGAFAAFSGAKRSTNAYRPPGAR